MQLTHRYPGRSRIRSGRRDALLQLAPDLGRDAVAFRGLLARPLALREALGALHAVVASDFRYRPKERAAFRAWLEEQDRRFLESLGIAEQAVRERLAEIDAELRELSRTWRRVSADYYAAQSRYFRHLFLRDYQAWVVLDPVITVHPDELFFEAFSQDESTYARVGVRYRVFREVDAFRCGTTNIDFSLALHRELRRMRSYRATRFDLDPGGFAVETARGSDGEAAVHHEKKIDLPRSWVRGFLEVQAAMTLGPERLALAAVDLYELIRVLKAHKARQGPRALVWHLEPGQRARVVVQPWDVELRLSPGAVYTGVEPRTIRTWGRDRLRLLERMLPACRAAHVHLLGDGMPCFFTVDTGDVSFTLGLSPWIKKDWAEAGFAHQPGGRPNDATLEQVFGVLRDVRVARVSELIRRAKQDRATVVAALRVACAAGRATYDLAQGVYRHRELFADPLPWQAESSAEREAAQWVRKRACRVTSARARPGGARVQGVAPGGRVVLEAGPAGELIKVTCTCGRATAADPCSHTLAVLLSYRSNQRNQ